jgi:type I restriction enzyme, S subunit
MTDLSKAGDTLGYGAFVPPKETGAFLHNQRIGLVEVSKPVPLTRELLFMTLLSPRYRAEVLGSATGSTVRHTSPTRILAHKTAVAPMAIQERASSTLAALRQRAESGMSESRTLAALRDKLLPKLVSGELPLRAAERAVETLT